MRAYHHPVHKIVEYHSVIGFGEAKSGLQANQKFRARLNVSRMRALCIDIFLFGGSEEERKSPKVFYGYMRGRTYNF
jgi:hypothetical protein